MKKWLIGVLATFAVLLIAVLGIDEWESRDLSPEEWRAARPEYRKWALSAAAEKLPEYAAQEGLSPEDFTGPMVSEDANPQEPTVTVRYKSDTHSFVYIQRRDKFLIVRND